MVKRNIKIYLCFDCVKIPIPNTLTSKVVTTPPKMNVNMYSIIVILSRSNYFYKMKSDVFLLHLDWNMKTFRTVITHNLHFITIIIISRFSFVIFTLFDLAHFKTFEMQIVRFCKFLLTCCFYIITIVVAVWSSCILYMITYFCIWH